MTTFRTLLLSVAAVAALVFGCTGPGPGSSATTSPIATPSAVSTPDTSVGRTGIGGRATAGPVCPVEKNPPDPACAPRPVAGAVIVIRTTAGAQVRRVITGADGTFFAEVPPGTYTIEPQAAEGTMGTPAAQQATVNAGGVTTIELGYDTGIR